MSKSLRRLHVILLSLACLALWPLFPTYAAGGIGGTGISALGVVQRFGSVFVNGREYFLTPQTQILVDGRRASEQELHLGDAVVVQGTVDPDTGRAEAGRVESRHEVVGTVSAMASQGAQLTVLGQRVHIGTATRVRGPHDQTLRLSDVRVGDVVRVSGLRRADRDIVATRVVREHGDAPRLFLLRGVVTEANRKYVEVDGQRIAWSAPLRAVRGQAVLVTGRMNGERLTAESIRVATPAVGKAGDRFEITGYVRRLGPTELVSSGIPLRYGPVTRFSGADRHDLSREPVAIEGHVQPDGRVAVERITVGVDVMRYGLPDLPSLERGVGPKREAAEPRPSTPPRDDGPEQRRQDSPEAKPETERPPVERPGVERPDVERPEVERPEIEKPEVMGE
jgi:hypothetical protein